MGQKLAAIGELNSFGCFVSSAKHGRYIGTMSPSASTSALSDFRLAIDNY